MNEQNVGFPPTDKVSGRFLFFPTTGRSFDFTTNANSMVKREVIFICLGTFLLSGFFFQTLNLQHYGREGNFNLETGISSSRLEKDVLLQHSQEEIQKESLLLTNTAAAMNIRSSRSTTSATRNTTNKTYGDEKHDKTKIGIMEEANRTGWFDATNGENKTKEYLCLKNLWAGNCNRILELARAFRVAREKNLELALLTDHNWFRSLFDPIPGITLPLPTKTLNCTVSMGGWTAYYTNFENHKTNPFLPHLAQLMWPSKRIREEAENAVRQKLGNKPFLSVHRRSMDGECFHRAGVGAVVGNDFPNNCTTQTMVTMCNLNYTTVQQYFNPTNLTVVLFTDWLQKHLDRTFPIVDDHDFFVQLWMMTLSERHVGNPVSTVDLVVNHWRYSKGNLNIMPADCYHKYREDYAKENLLF